LCHDHHRTLAQCQVGDFQAALSTWLRECLADSETEGVLAVDGKTAKQGLDDNGHPLHMLNAFVHDLQVVVGQWSTGAEKTNEPTLLRHHLEELLNAYPMLQLITGDAIFAQRPLADLICAKNRDCSPPQCQRENPRRSGFPGTEKSVK
jgi:hypothetical protein